MTKSIRTLPILAAAGLLILLSSGCTRKAREARALHRADDYFAAGRYDAAEIEYMNVLRLDRMNPSAMGRLGIIYSDQGRVGRSVPFLLGARQLEPDNLEVRLKAGLYFLAIGKFSYAKNEAEFILDKNPRDADAPLLLAEAAVRPDEIENARRSLERLPDAGSAPVLVALGTLDFRQRQFDQAENSFRLALAADPNSGAAYTALGALYWEKGDLAPAGAAFARAAELAPAEPGKGLQYAQFKIKTGDLAGGRQILEELNRASPAFLPAAMLLAQLDEAEKKYDDSQAQIAKIFDRDPTYPDALLLSARLKIAKGQPEKAVAELERAEGIYPNYPQIEYELAQAYQAVGEPEKAANSLNQALLAAPNLAEATIALAKIDIQTGDPGAAIISLKKLIQKRPEMIEPRLLLANTYVDQGNFEDALDVYARLATLEPRNSQPIVLTGLVLLRQNKRGEARDAFNAALDLNPGYFPAVEELVFLDVGEQRYDAARRLVESQIDGNPRLSEPYVLLAKIHLAQKAWPEAEAALKKAIQIEPAFPTPYYLLAELYFVTHQDRNALANLQEAVRENPKDTSALMLIGAIEDRQDHHAAARDAYQEVLAVDPGFSPALNNLAYLYSEDFGQLDKAFEMAQKARVELPNDPHAADTLGWILYKKHQYAWALSLLQESVEALPADAEAQFHLGMTQYMLGLEEPARASLERALQLSGDFPGSEDAKRSVSVLAIDVATAGPAEQALLEKAATDRPDDPVVLARLAAVYERGGAAEKAIGVYETLLQKNPKDLTALIQLARLYGARQDTAKAFELAKTAHDLAPDDPDVAGFLGRLAYLTSDYTWAASLLHDSAAKRPNDPDVLLDLAEATYAVGRVSDAEAALRAALGGNPGFARAAEARRFLELIHLPDNSSPAAAAEAEHILGQDPKNLPALVALAEISDRRGDPGAAERTYEKVLGYYPNFLPAEKSLVMLYAENPGNDPLSLDLVNKAREAFPDDPDVAKAGGILAYRQGDYQRAANLLTESAGQHGDDGELIFYLGMAEYRLNDPASRQTLRRALGLDLRSDFADQARQTLDKLK
jgi:tetratricopeptide (TPR) repeat protein